MSHPSPSLGASQQSASTYFSIDPCSLEVQGVPPHQSHHQTPCSAQTAMTNYDLFSTSSFNCNFPRNDNQTFNVCTESTLSIYRKGLCTFFRFWNSPRKILYQPKCRDQRECSSCNFSKRTFRLVSFSDVLVLSCASETISLETMLEHERPAAVSVGILCSIR